ncbi:glycosyl transferase family 2 [Acuticoccus sediminis]|uniref:Glycosyl transferase family 2 n=1 Tax=Acuticoccus sediminis TaxID=2184697 RepID=A0A8B2NDK1_9HYPH|nr:glycosyltransferase [Acuticoccus sediminis]RAH96555.1 glycosyl transferase family 2 [Acuticoccus sediminis]
MTPLPPGIHAIVAFDGVAEIVCRDEDVLSGVTVRCGSESFPVQAVESRRRVAGSIAGPEVLGTLAAAVVDGPALKATLNNDVKWTVAGGKTLSVWFETPTPPRAVVKLAPEGKAGIPAGPKSYRVEALAGAHRVTGTLIFEAVGERGQVLHAFSTAVRTEHFGGPSAANHAVVSGVLPAHPRTQAIAIRFEVGTLSEAAAKTPAVLFLSEVRVGLNTGAPAVPPSLGLGNPAAGGVVGRVDLAGCGEAPVTVAAGGAEVELPLPAPVRIAGTQAGHSGVALSAEEDGTFTLYVDDTFVSSIPVGARSSIVTLPRALLNGTERVISVRDRYGMRTLWRCFAVLEGMMTPYTAVQREGGRPVPMALANAARYRYAALGALLAEGPSAAETLQVAHAHKVLGLGFEMLDEGDVRPLAFPEVETPDVSVVIPAHNKFEITYHGLCALLVARNKASFEVIVVDDGSSDRTTGLADLVSGIRVIRNDTAQRFIRACNQGVAASKGRYVVLLNNDTEPTVGWLDALIDPFERFEDVGLTGAKLLYPDGTLQEAGGIVWRSGNPWNYGRGANPLDPRYSYVRQADYLSGAAMMTTRAIWDELGGLSAYLEPMYFEDTDFAFKVRAAGRKTMFVPGAVVYHHEGKTSGTEVTSGMKAFQEVNRPKFKSTWASAFRAFGPEGQDVDLEKDRGIVGRVLFIDYAMPRPDRDAGSYAAVEEMKLVQALGFKATFLPRNLADLGHYKSDLEAQGIEVITAPFSVSVQAFLEERGGEFDVVYITRYGVARDFIDAVRKNAPQARIMLMNADLHFLREVREAMATGDPNIFARAEATREDELDAMKRCDLTLSYNEVEHAVIASHALGEVRVAKCPWVVRLRADVPPFEARSGTAFLGGFKHPPNRAAVLWFAEKVVPELVSRGVGGDFSVYGSAMPDEIRALEGEGIRTPGFIENVDELHDAHRIFVAPLLAGAGLKGKVVGALAAGIPCVLSPVAAEGIGLRSGYDCLIAREPREWVEAIARLDTDAALWRKLSENGRALVEEQYSFAVGRDLMREAFHKVGIYHTL